jgi:hypothetical protein
MRPVWSRAAGAVLEPVKSKDCHRLPSTMAHPDELIIGDHYFLVKYYDDDLLVPDVTTLVYEGTAETDDGIPMWLFKEPHSGPEGPDRGPLQTGVQESQLHEVLDLTGLLATLHELRDVQPQRRKFVEWVAPDELLEKSGIPGSIGGLLESVPETTLHINIRYRDAGLFLRRRAAGVALNLFLQPLRHADQNESLREIMQARQLQPNVDYLANMGRTRVLEYQLPERAEVIAELCVAILIAVHKIAASDEVVISASLSH